MKNNKPDEPPTAAVTEKLAAKISTKEIMEIIKWCAKMGVSSIKIEKFGMDVQFSGEPIINTRLSSAQEHLVKKEEKHLNAISREMTLSQMDIENPSDYENLIINEGEKEFINANAEQRRT